MFVKGGRTHEVVSKALQELVNNVLIVITLFLISINVFQT